MSSPDRPPRAAAVILAAGLSARMGAHKALLQFGDCTALEVLARSIREASSLPIVVVASAGEVAAEARRLGLPAVENKHPESGRTGSLQCALAALHPELAILVASVDSPLVAPGTVRYVLAAPAAAAVARPRTAAGPGHPVRFSSALRSEIAALAPDAPLRDVVHRHRAEIADVPVADSEIHANMNTPEEYQRALERFRAASAR